MESKKTSFLKIFFISLLLFIFFDLLLGNFIYKKFIRVNFVDQDTSFAKKNEIYDHGFLESYKTNNAGWGNKRYTFCTDKNSFRSNCKNLLDNSKNFDIAFIGDSFTEGVGLNYEKSFVGIISNKLNEFKIANLSASSYSPAIYFSKINYFLEKGYYFDEVIVFIDLSDIQDDAVCYKIEDKIVKRRSNEKDCFQQNQSYFNKLKKRFKLTKEFFYLIKNKLIEIKIINYNPPGEILNNPRSNWTFNYNKIEFNNLPLDKALGISIKNMQMLSNLLKSKKIDLSVAVYPWPSTLKYDTENNKQLQTWKNFCISNCKNFFNLMKPFFNLKDKNSFSWIYNHAYIKNDIHLNEVGNEIIADNFLKLYKR